MRRREPGVEREGVSVNGGGFVWYIFIFIETHYQSFMQFSVSWIEINR